MNQPIYIVDAFTDRPFAGNPAAVCPVALSADATWMQQVAAEMNLAETAFVYSDGGVWRLRWFTPTVEVDLCGHATLATAHILWETGQVERGSPIEFVTRSGLLGASPRGTEYELDFPALPVTPTVPPAVFQDILGAVPVWVGTNGMDFFAELADETAVRSLTPDLERLATLLARGLIVTSRSDDPARCDFVSRFFAPASGIPEDAVTGSAHCALGPYWAERLGRSDLTGYQASRRGGRVRVVVREGRVTLGGQAVTMLRGHLAIPCVSSDLPWPSDR